MKFVKSGFVSGVLFSSLRDFHRSRKKTKILETARCVLHEKKVYSTHKSGAERNMMKIFVLISGKSDKEEKIRVGKVLLMLCCVVGGRKNKNGNEMAFAQFLECIPLLATVDDALECVCLRCVVAESRENETDLGTSDGENSRTVAGERSRATPLESILSTISVVSASTASHPLTTEVPCSRHWFCIGRFFRKCAMK